MCQFKNAEGSNATLISEGRVDRRARRFLGSVSAAAIAALISMTPAQARQSGDDDCGFCQEECPDDPSGSQVLAAECLNVCGEYSEEIQCEVNSELCGLSELFVRCGEET